MELGNRVQFISGVLTGEKATIILSPDGTWKEEDEIGTDIYIQFDRRDAELGPDQGYATLEDRWTNVGQLKVIS